MRSDHEVLFLVIHGQETGIRVRLGDHKQDIGKALQSKLARELHMPNAEWLGQFQSWERSLEDYVSHLMANGTLPPDF